MNNYIVTSFLSSIGLSFTGLIFTEVFLGIALAGGFLQLAQAEVPTVPKWLLDIGIVLFVIFSN